MAEIITKTTERNPYILVCFQECERMNLLLAEIRKSLNELDLGLKVESLVIFIVQTALLYQLHFISLMRISLTTGRIHHLFQHGDSAVCPVQ